MRPSPALGAGAQGRCAPVARAARQARAARNGQKRSQHAQQTWQARDAQHGPEDRKEAMEAVLEVRSGNVAVEVVHEDAARGSLGQRAKLIVGAAFGPGDLHRLRRCAPALLPGGRAGLCSAQGLRPRPPRFPTHVLGVRARGARREMIY
jgi:hypothetical protein